MFATVRHFDVVFQMLDFVACLPPSRGHESAKCEYLIDRFKAEVEGSYVLIGAFEICIVFRRMARSVLSEVRPFSCFEEG